MDVALIDWPSGERLRQEMATTRQPRLLLVESGAAPPDCHDAIEDWVRLPVSSADRDARVRALAAKAGVAGAVERPSLQNTGSLEFRGQRAQLSELQVALARVMIDHMGSVVARSALVAAAWHDAAPGENTLDVAMSRLRGRLHPVGLQVRTVRSRGYLLVPSERSGSRQEPVGTS